MYECLHVQHPLFLSYVNETWNFLDKPSENSSSLNFMEIRPLGSEFHADGHTVQTHIHMYTDRQTDITKLIVPFRNFANQPKTDPVYPFRQ